MMTIPIGWIDKLHYNSYTSCTRVIGQKNYVFHWRPWEIRWESRFKSTHRKGMIIYYLIESLIVICCSVVLCLLMNQQFKTVFMFLVLIIIILLFNISFILYLLFFSIVLFCTVAISEMCLLTQLRIVFARSMDSVLFLFWILCNALCCNYCKLRVTFKFRFQSYSSDFV